MRRIIERIVTVVTTTTWKISWEADPHSSPVKVDPVSLQSSDQEMLQSTAPGPTTIEAKEVDVSERKDHNETNGG